MELEVAMVYARAMYDVAKDLGKVEEIKGDMITIQHIFDRKKQFKEIMVNPAISNVKKKEMIRKALGGATYEEILSLLYILIDKGRFSYYDKVVSQYSQIVDSEDKVSAGVIYSACRLNIAHLNAFEDAMSKMTGKKVSLYNRVDRDLIGGVRIVVDGKIIDASLKANLEKLSGDIKAV